ncbi:MAG: hypothetical protein R2752_03215 [Vicinamibacterales bacterium]
MRQPHRHCLAVVLSLCLAAASPSTPRATSPAQATELDGTWVGQYSEAEGQRRDFKPGEVRMVFQGNQARATGIVSPDEATLGVEVNPRTTPRQLDYWISPDGSKTLCVYEVAGDTLRIGVPRSGGRPTAISSAKGSRTVVLVLKRQ